MPRIFKNFGTAFRPLNYETNEGEDCVRIPGGRAYLRINKYHPDETVPYLDNIHLNIEQENWQSHQAMAQDVEANPSLHDRIYAGCAGYVNLDYITSMHAPAALLYDINPLQTIFWQDFFDLVAAHPVNADFADAFPDFCKSLYLKLEQIFGKEALKNQTEIRSFLPGEAKPAYYGDRMSPFRNMDYKDCNRWAAERMTGRNFRDEWLASPDKYRHLHLLAKHRAIGFVTLDIRDETACRRVAETLETVPYIIGDYSRGNPVRWDDAETIGGKIGLLYRSNVGHYMKWDWSPMELAQIAAGKIVTMDFAKKPKDLHSYDQACRNLRTWFSPVSAHQITCDRHTGGEWGQFYPTLEKIPQKELVPA